MNNILIDTSDQLYFIDFDKARIRRKLGDWQWGPLYRLQRSINKFDSEFRPGHAADDWQALMDGYKS